MKGYLTLPQHGRLTPNQATHLTSLLRGPMHVSVYSSQPLGVLARKGLCELKPAAEVGMIEGSYGVLTEEGRTWALFAQEQASKESEESTKASDHGANDERECAQMSLL